MLAGHIDTVFVLVAADHTGVWVGLHAYQCHFDLADICLVSADFKDGFIFQFEGIAQLILKGKSFPSTVCRAIVFNVILSFYVSDCGMSVAEVLVVWEIQQIVGFSSYCDFPSCFRYLH